LLLLTIYLEFCWLLFLHVLLVSSSC